MSNIIERLRLVPIATITDMVTIDEICTSNHMYQISRWGKRKVLVKKPSIAKIQSSIEKQLVHLRPEIPENFICFSILVKFIFDAETFLLKYKDELKRRDLTNLYKPIEDGICSGLGIDDSKSIKNDLRKFIVNDSDQPYKIAFNIEFYGTRSSNE